MKRWLERMVDQEWETRDPETGHKVEDRESRLEKELSTIRNRVIAVENVHSGLRQALAVIARHYDLDKRLGLDTNVP